MARQRIRTLKPEWRTDEKLIRCSDAARVLSAGLITLADDEGRGEANLVWLATTFKGERSPQVALRKTKRALAELRGWFVELYEVGGAPWFQLLNFVKHQYIDRPSRSALPPPPSANSPNQSPNRSPSGGSAHMRAGAHPEIPDPAGDREEGCRGEGPPPLNPSSPTGRAPSGMALAVARELAGLVAGRLPHGEAARQAERTAQRWAGELDALQAESGRDWSRVAEVLRWSQRDPFWQSRVLSAKVLAKNFDAIEAQMQAPPRNGDRGLTAEEIFRQAAEAAEAEELLDLGLGGPE